MSRIFLQTLGLLVSVSLGFAVVCFDCYGTGPTHRNCTRERNCTGGACLIFEAGDNVTSTAFCLMNIKPPSGSGRSEPESGCWLEPDGVGKHCLCKTDFCNRLRDRTLAKNSDPFDPPIPELGFLKHNPLLDYDEEDEDDAFGGSRARPAPKNVLFPAAAEIDPKIAGDFHDEDDLVPIDFNDYQNAEMNIHNADRFKVRAKITNEVVTQSPPTPSMAVRDPEIRKNLKTNAIGGEQHMAKRREDEANAAFAPLPSYVVLLAPMAASLARCLSAFL
ncbi:hypothetical protein L596_027850 [Steinernema carpocapsae]|uniref:Activin types I and II receptor domain-containing protein n=1 Tax=Steinernema carpocapsae TaxID=34508 RepID=A0A4U5LWR6_STECR|nr:hypothetical protein L596_027850 [Steinernema carpocapsae]